MSDCSRIEERLAPYADGALGPDERADLERHIERCPPCRRAAEEADAGRTVLRARASVLARAALPPGLRSRCESIALEGRRAQGSWWRRLVPAVAVLALVAGTAVVILSLASRSEWVLTRQLTLDHWKCVRFESAVTPLDASDAGQTLERRFGRQFPVPPTSAAAGLTLVGVRRCLFGLGTVPHIIYRAGNQHLSLYVLNNVKRERADVDALGHHSTIWSDGPSTYVLVSERADAGLTRAVQYMMEQVH
jgi:anti-sigma factor RsiW